jgi:hypothetical protein
VYLRSNIKEYLKTIDLQRHAGIQIPMLKTAAAEEEEEIEIEY